MHYFEDTRRCKVIKALSSDCGKLHDTILWCSFQTRDSQSRDRNVGQKVIVFIYSPCFNICCLCWEQSYVATPLWMLVAAFLNLKKRHWNKLQSFLFCIYLWIGSGNWRVNSKWTQKKQTVWVLVCKTNFQCVAHRLSLIVVNK